MKLRIDVLRRLKQKSRFLCLSLLAAMGTGALVAATPETVSIGKIVFSSQRDGNSEIYVMNADGSNQTRLTNDAASDQTPVFNAEGSKIAFTSDRDGEDDVYVMNADGSNVQRLTSASGADVAPAFSPDGGKIVFASTRGDKSAIYVMNADGSNQQAVTNGTQASSHPAFHPNGNQVIYREAEKGLFVINLDGTGRTQLSTQGNTSCNYPVYSPDGQKIVYYAFVFGDTRPYDHVFTMNADGSGHANLTADKNGGQMPSWSPDGSRIAFTSFQHRTYGDIYTMNVDGGGPVRLTQGTNGDGLDPSWAPGSVPAPPEITVASSAIREGNTGQTDAKFTISLSLPSSQPVSVNYATADGTAKADSDYQSTSGTLQFAPGETEKTVFVPVVGDTKAEPDEYFFLVLSEAVNATLPPSDRPMPIQNDDEFTSPTISIYDSSGKEGDRSSPSHLEFTVTLDPVQLSDYG
jgi:hypothetical protein